MELRRYLHLLRRRIVLLALAVAVGLAAGYTATDRTPKYQAHASIYVGSRQFAAISESTNASAAMERLVQTFAAMIKSDAVATAALQATKAPRSSSALVAHTVAAVVPNTNYIVVFVSDTDPGVAQSLANGLAQSFVAEVQSLEPGTGGAAAAATGGAAATTTTTTTTTTTAAGAAPPAVPAPAPATAPAVTSVVQLADRPGAPLPTSTKRRVVLGGLFGLAGGLVVVALLNYLDTSVKNAEDLERATDLPVLGIIPILSHSSAQAQILTPGAPGAPGAPSAPSAPSEPGAPGAPSEPGAPGAPSVPSPAK